MTDISPANKEAPATKDFVFFDLETTGLDLRVHEIIEIGAIRVSPDLATLRETFTMRVQPQHIKTAMPEALAVNGFSEDEWKGAPSLKEALAAFCVLGDGGMLTAYNITFDWSFLHVALLAEGIESHFDYHRFDIFSIAYEYVLEHGGKEKTLREMCERFGISVPPGHHRALADAQAALDIFRAIRAK